MNTQWIFAIGTTASMSRLEGGKNEGEVAEW
jgi:hypothetical protein